jgi:O-antigen ligase
MQLWVLLITALVPLAIAPGLLSAFDITPKITILLFCDSILLLFCKQIVNGAETLYKSASGRLYMACLGVQWLSMAASTCWSSNPALSVWGSSWRRDGLIGESAILMFAFAVAAWCAEDPGRIRVVLRTAVLAGAAASLYGIAQYFGWDPLLPAAGYQSGEGPFTIVRPPGTLGHADYFANWLVMVVFFALALVRLEDDCRWKFAANASLILAALAIVLSGTRSALLGLIAGAIVFLVIARPRLHREALLASAAAAACLVLLYVSPAGVKLRARVHWSAEDLRGGARLLLWRDSLHMAMQHPMLGFGPETFTGQFPPFASVELSRAYPDFYRESPHNMFLDALTSRGLPGAIFLLALCLLGVWAARRNAALAAALVGAVVCQQFVVLTIPTALYFYLLLSMLVQSTIPIGQTEPRPFPRLIIPIAAVIALVFLVFATRLTLADRAMALAEQRAAAGDVQGAADAYGKVQRWEPSRGDSDLRYSRAMMRLATTTRAFSTSVAAAQQSYDSAVRATTTAEDRQNAWYNLATIAALRNDRAGVENGLRNAIACAPNWFKPHWTLSQFLELTGRHAEARREAALAMELDGGHDTDVTSTSHAILSRP